MDRTAKTITVRLGGLTLAPRVRPLLGNNIMVVVADLIVPAGRILYGQKLTEPYVIQAGSLLYSRWVDRGKGRRERIYHHCESIYDALRAQTHTLRSEEHARADAQISIEGAVAIVYDLLAHWPLTPRQRQRLHAKLFEMKRRYDRARKESLQQATAQIMEAVPLRDRRGRPNPGVVRARLTTARERFEMRLTEITAIVPHLNRFRAAIIQELARIWRLLDQDYNLLQRRLSRALPRATAPSHLRWIAEHLRLIHSHVASIHVAPFCRNGRYLEAELKEALAILEDETIMLNERVARIEPLISVMCASIRFKRAQRELERIIYRLATRIEAKTLTRVKAERAAQAVDGFCDRVIAKLDEGAFKRRRLFGVARYLRCAALQLRIGKPKQAKESLKLASALL